MQPHKHHYNQNACENNESVFSSSSSSSIAILRFLEKIYWRGEH